jgi:citrate lyase subunit gamma (acyl carrier protein)
MAEIQKTAVAGTLESSDIMVTIEPHNSLEIVLQSVVDKQFGNSIKQTILETLQNQNITNAKVTAVDKGALNFTIIARVKTAITRGLNI